MPREFVPAAASNDPSQVQIGWGKEAEYVQLATNDGEDHKGKFVRLDRRGCNTLIRKLRRARDDAFGRDE